MANDTVFTVNLGIPTDPYLFCQTVETAERMAQAYSGATIEEVDVEIKQGVTFVPAYIYPPTKEDSDAAQEDDLLENARIALLAAGFSEEELDIILKKRSK